MNAFLRVAITCLSLCALTAIAQTRYVSDQLVITLRTGPSTQNAISRNLTSGDRVEVLEVLPAEGYSRVRTTDGEEGWVLTQYLQDELTAAQQLDRVNRDFAVTDQRRAELEAELEAALADLAATRETRDSAEMSTAQLAAELDNVRSASASALETREQNERLRARVSELTAANEMAQTEIADLRSRERQNWFVVGAAVLFGGIVIGLVAPSLRRQRRSSW